MDPERVARARAWADEDPDPETRSATLAMIAAGDEEGLRDCFDRRLSFGTAGLRGALGPGPNRMNRATVRRVTAGLAAWCAGRGDGPVVIGRDARRGSAAFAEDAARVLVGAGLPVIRLPGTCPTPLLAYAVRRLGARAGVMVTASHNPPSDNGYKVYDALGAQIVPPSDREISAAIDRVGALADLPLGPEGAGAPPPIDLEEAYLAEVEGLRVHRGGAPLRIAYTPLHGVGLALLRKVLARGGHTDLSVVAEQAEPDGGFPTVAFPNPEEPGALDRVLALAARTGADLVLANDPDADRIAAAVPDGRGGFRLLSGNDTGTLLAEDLLAHGPAGPRLVACSLVSSTLLAKVARHHGAAHVETLTGFKWIARAGFDRPERYVLGYEEALGVCAGTVVRDKDGLSAALLLCDLAAFEKARGRTLIDALDGLHRRHGVHLSDQLSLVLPGEAGIARFARAMASLRADPPARAGGRPVVALLDGSAGERRVLATGARSPLAVPRSDVLGLELLGGDRVLVRPSGTEPKLKVYLEVVEPVGADGLEAARGRASERLSALRSDLDARIASVP